MGDETIKITIGELRDAFITWENDRRENPSEYMTTGEINDETAGEIGVSAADHLWSLLRKAK